MCEHLYPEYKQLNITREYFMLHARVVRCDAVSHPPHGSDLETTFHETVFTKLPVIPPPSHLSTCSSILRGKLLCKAQAVAHYSVNILSLMMAFCQVSPVNIPGFLHVLDAALHHPRHAVPDLGPAHSWHPRPGGVPGHAAQEARVVVRVDRTLLN